MVIPFTAPERNQGHPDFRADYTQRFVERVCTSVGTESLILIHGEAGAGKSYLLDAVQRQCRAQKTDLFTFRFRNTDQESVLAALLDWLETTNSPGSAMGRLKPTQAPDRDWERCLRHLRDFPKRLVLSFVDCHLLEPGPAKVLAELILAVRAMGVQLLVEYRDSEEDLSEAWRDVLKSLQGSPGVCFKKVGLLDIGDVTALVSQYLHNDLLHEAARSLFTKTGGNPLFLAQVFNYFEGLKVLRRKPDRGYHLQDHQGLMRALQQLPDSLTSFLEIKINYFFSHLPQRLRHPTAAYLALASLTSQPMTQTLAQHFLNLEPHLQRDAASHAFRAMILYQSGDATDFVHDMMRLSMLAWCQRSRVVHDLLAPISDRKDPNRIDHCLISGAAQHLRGEHKSAFQDFKTGAALAKHQGRFADQCYCLREMVKLAGQQQRTPQDRMTWVEATFDLGVAEGHAGSQLDAEAQLLKVIEIQKETFIASFHAKLIGVQLNARERLATLYHRGLYPEKGTGVLQMALSWAEQPFNLLQLMNRLMLVAFNSNAPQIALEPPHFGQWILPEDPHDLLASTLSNTGSILLHADPHNALRVWRAAHKVAQNDREQVHAKLNLVTGAWFLNQAPDVDAAELDEAVDAQGVHSLIIRNNHQKALDLMDQGGLDQAVRLMEHALRMSVNFNLNCLTWMILNNLFVAKVMKTPNRVAEHAVHLENALEMLMPTVRFLPVRKERIGACMRGYQQQLAATTAGNTPTPHPVFATSIPIPAYSGSFPILFQNLHQLEQHHPAAITNNMRNRLEETRAWTAPLQALDAFAKKRHPLYARNGDCPYLTALE